MIWKILLAQIREEIYDSLISEEQKYAASGPEVQESYNTFINTCRKAAKRDGKILQWPGLTTKSDTKCSRKAG